ncbi:glycosyltransferase [Pleurocapsales cyanobacterium LEGE 10410]|nr:glycosyltransferase [Pleurocapsales cyanobacterium LEGE 10410]
MPKVSVLMCVYNGEAHVREALESILEQTFTNLEFVIVEDGSTDSTWEILTKYAERDSRIVLIRNEENLGLERSLNKGLAACQGEYFARQDADDVSLPNRLQLQTNFLDTHPEVGALGTAVELIDEQGAVLRENYLPVDYESIQARLMLTNFLHHSTLIARHSLMQDLGGYNITCRYAEDYDLWWRLNRRSRLATLPDILLRRRMDNRPRISKRYRREQLQRALALSLQAVRESLEDSSSLDKEAYQRFWWAYLRSVNKETYRKFWETHQGRQGQLSWKDFQSLRPLWKLLEKHPGGSSWEPILHRMACQHLEGGQILEGLLLLGIIVRQLKMPIQWKSVAKHLVKSYVSSLGNNFFLRSPKQQEKRL